MKIAALEGRGLLARQGDEDDARRRFGWLTPWGRDHWAQAQQVLDTEVLRDAAAALDPAERARLLALLERLDAALCAPKPVNRKGTEP